eukprot:6777891-Prymnesium_polylepis.1
MKCPFRLRRLERLQSVMREASAGREFYRATSPASWRALQLQDIRRPSKPSLPSPRVRSVYSYVSRADGQRPPIQN